MITSYTETHRYYKQRCRRRRRRRALLLPDLSSLLTITRALVSSTSLEAVISLL